MQLWYDMLYWILMWEIWHKGSSAVSLWSPVVDQENMRRAGYFLVEVSVFFSSSVCTHLYTLEWTKDSGHTDVPFVLRGFLLAKPCSRGKWPWKQQATCETWWAGLWTTCCRRLEWYGDIVGGKTADNLPYCVWLVAAAVARWWSWVSR